MKIKCKANLTYTFNVKYTLRKVSFTKEGDNEWRIIFGRRELL